MVARVYTRAYLPVFIGVLITVARYIGGEFNHSDAFAQGLSYSPLIPSIPAQPGDVVPRPDPTALTTSALMREVMALQQQITAVKEIIETRLQASDKAIALLRDQSDKIPGYTDTKIGALHNLLSERFKGMELQFEGVQLQFKERDERQNISAKATETAINAALQAQKESVTAANTSFAEATRKAEVGTKERLDQLTTLFQTETKALAAQLGAISKSLDDKIVVVDRRLGLIEGSGLGLDKSRGLQDTSNQLIIGIVGVLLVVIGLAVTILIALRPHPTPMGNGSGNR